MKAAMREKARTGPVPAKISEAIRRRIVAQEWWHAIFQAGIYRSTDREPSTEGLLADLWAKGDNVAVPVQCGGAYRWSWVGPETVWRRGGHGILEPERARVATTGDLRVIFVPGLAFDFRGGRLGHGGGNFDRLLAHADGLVVGLCPESRIVESVPMEAHDVRMDALATENRMIYATTAAAKLERLAR